jgi:outer membrane scaffolding protein for murein synthesis (MipA/OmpV family)
LKYTTSLGALVGNTNLNAHFYSVAPQYATASRPAYEAKSGLIAIRLGTSFTKPLSRDWRMYGFARLDTVTGAANVASPLVERRSGASFGLGLSYTWMRSEGLAAD